MNNRTWTVKLMATDEHPEATVHVSQEDAVNLLRGLMYGPGSPEYAYVEAATHQTRAPGAPEVLAA